MRALIAVVEDEEDLLELLEFNLQNEGYETIGLPRGKRLKQLIYEENISLIIMDRNLPDMEGSELVADLRKKGIKIPVVFLTAKGDGTQIEEGFMRGGDDYMTKPFNMRELLLRVKAILTRSKNYSDEDELTYRDITLHLLKHEATISGELVHLTKLEFELLLTLIQNRDQVLGRDYLLQSAWGDEEIHQGRTVNVAINRLKEKIDPLKKKNYIKSVRGIGYTLA